MTTKADYVVAQNVERRRKKSQTIQDKQQSEKERERGEDEGTVV